MNPHELFSHANDFWDAADRLVPKFPQNPAPGDQVKRLAFAPHITCIAFATEIYLKCLLRIETGKNAPNGHNLKLLFNRLSAQTVERLERDWKSHPAAVHYNTAIRLPLGLKQASMLDALEESAGAFENWRYSFESDPGSWTASPAVQIIQKLIEERLEIS
jgi:hypothetical protein